MEIEVVEGDTLTLALALSDANGPALPVPPVTFTLGGFSTTADVSPGGVGTVTLTDDMTAVAGVHLARFVDADGNRFPSDRDLRAVVLGHTRPR